MLGAAFGGTRGWLAIAAALGVSACTEKKPEGTGLDCFPKEAARWLASGQQQDEFAGRKDEKGQVTVYVDASGSMVGYVDGATEAERPLHDLLGSLENMFPAGGSPLTYKTFGTRIRPVEAGKHQQILAPGFFSCRGRAAADCDNKETRLDLVMREVEAQKDGLALVITDMWFSDPSSVTSGLVPLADPVENILADGRTIGVYGIPAPFAGKIFDLPGGASAAFTGKRPLILLAIGSKERVRGFTQQLARSPSAYLAQGMSSGGIRQSLFTIDPSSEVARSSDPLSAGNDPRVRRATVLDAIENVRVQQFRLERSGALRAPREPTDLPEWRGPDPRAFVDKAVWEGPMATRSLVWQRLGERCIPTDWSNPVKFSGGWHPAQQGGQSRYRLDPASFAAAFRRPGIYLVTGEVARTSLNQPNGATAWLRDWSFSTAQGRGESAAGGAPFYRTLNLGEFSRLLENALADAAERNPGPITGFTYVVEVAD